MTLEEILAAVDELDVGEFGATEYREVLEFFGWSPRDAAAALGIHETRSRKWANGKTPIPSRIAARLTVAQALIEAPPPLGGETER